MRIDMQMLIFLLGSAFTLALQFLSSRISMLREQVKESWMRRLNSYQDFRTATVGLLDLWAAEVAVPADRVWNAIADARKAALDAVIFDADHDALTDRMLELTAQIARLAGDDHRPAELVSQLRDDADGVWRAFARREPSLQRDGGPWWRWLSAPSPR